MAQVITPRTIWGGLGNQMFQHAYILGQIAEKKIPDLYLQDEKYFKKCKRLVKAMYGEGIGHIDKVSLHIRRGDYLNNPFYIDLTETDYYERAIAMFPNENFLVFCADRQEGSDDQDDMKWCKERFKGEQFEFFQGENEIEDMNMMASCKAHILANSSFSWWAAYLGEGKTIAPKKWFTDDVERIKLLDSWEII